MRAFWSGVVSFGLVNIPVNLYTATEEGGMDFDYLHKSDRSRIRYARMCKAEDREVPFKEIVRGFAIRKNEYVVIEDDDFERAYPKATRTIEIHDFVREDEIESVYFEKPYYLEPEKSSGKAYRLLHDALKKSGAVGMATFVMRHRQYLAIIKPWKNLLILNELRWDHQLRSSDEVAVPKTAAPSPRELSIAQQLIKNQLRTFRPSAYRDTFTQKMHEIIAKKSRGHTVEPTEEAPEPTHINDLMAMLQRSLKEREGRQKIKA